MLNLACLTSGYSLPGINFFLSKKYFHLIGKVVNCKSNIYPLPSHPEDLPAADSDQFITSADIVGNRY